jgi:hypothetical protein
VAERSPLIQILRTPPTQSPASAAAAPEPAQWPAVAARLREYAAARPRPSSAERCEFCGTDIAETHGHVVNLAQRTLLCVCRGCYLLFTQDGAGGARFRAVPERYQLVPEFAAAREAWDALQVPIGLAFFFTNSATGQTKAFYPSPAGATESELPLDAWTDVVRAIPPLAGLASDVEALLVRRTETHAEGLIVPIDACYELVGRIRRAWRGFQGGDDVWREIDEFFARAMERARLEGV